MSNDQITSYSGTKRFVSCEGASLLNNYARYCLFIHILGLGCTEMEIVLVGISSRIMMNNLQVRQSCTKEFTRGRQGNPANLPVTS